MIWFEDFIPGTIYYKQVKLVKENSYTHTISWIALEKAIIDNRLHLLDSDNPKDIWIVKKVYETDLTWSELNHLKYKEQITYV